jgi:hypothetical protein
MIHARAEAFRGTMARSIMSLRLSASRILNAPSTTNVTNSTLARAV